MEIKKRKSRENGEIMLEGMFIMVITMLILVWLLAIGFIYYQRYTTTVVANDAAVKIASTYNNPSSDIIMGYVTTEDVSARDLYRNFPDSRLRSINEKRATEYVKYILDKANFSGVVEDVEVELELVLDSAVRKHVKLTVTCEYNTPFGEALEFFGMKRSNTYSVVACSDCTDILDYYATVSFEKALKDGSVIPAPGIVNDGIKLVNSTIKMIKKLVEVFN